MASGTQSVQLECRYHFWLAGNKGSWEKNRITKLWICSSAPFLMQLVPVPEPLLPGASSSWDLGTWQLPACSAQQQNMGWGGAGLLSAPSYHRCCWTAPPDKEKDSILCLSDYLVPKFFIKWRIWGRKSWKPFHISHPISCNRHLEVFLTLIFESGVFLPIGQKTDKCGFGLANKSIKIVQPSAKKGRQNHGTEEKTWIKPCNAILISVSNAGIAGVWTWRLGNILL